MHVHSLRLTRLEAVQPHEEMLSQKKVSLGRLLAAERGLVMNRSIVIGHPPLRDRSDL
jgi:hypothetical protein